MNDDGLSRLVLRLFATTYNSLSIVGRGLRSAPIFRVLATPFFLKQDLQIARYRLGLMVDSIRLSKFTSIFTWGGRGVGIVGDAVSNITNAFMGGTQLLGLSQTTAFGLTFTLIFPIFLVVVGAIGGAAEATTMRRTAQALKKFNAEKQNIGSILHSLEGSEVTNQVSEAVQEIYDSCEEHLVDNEQARALLEDLKQLTAKLMNPEQETELELIDEARTLVKTLKAFAQGEIEAIDYSFTQYLQCYI